MKKILFTILIGGQLFYSCSSDDDDSKNVENPIQGEWTVVDIVCLCPPYSTEKGSQIWNFDVDKNVLEVTNDEDVANPVLESGSRPITITENEVLIESVKYEYSFDEDNNLILSDNPEIDGALITLERL